MFKSSRRSEIAPFYAMEVLRAANQRAATGADVFHLELGEPARGAPRRVLDAAHATLDSASIGYTEALGVPALRDRIVAHYDAVYGIEIDRSQVVVTTGASGGFVLGFLAAFDQGDRVAIAEPCYPAYRNILAALGLEVVPLPASPADNFQPTPALLAAAGDLDGLIVASPSNPTGTMLHEPAFRGLCDYCRTAGIRLVSDEIYHGITYGPDAVTALALDQHAIVVNSFSKFFAMTGWRLGWMVCPADLVDAVERLAQNVFISPPTLSQQAAMTAFECRDELQTYVAEYARSRALLLDALPKVGFDKLSPAEGAFYIYADVSALTDDSQAFCARLLNETGVAMTPGIDFDPRRGSRYLRISFAAREDTIAAAATRIATWMRAAA